MAQAEKLDLPEKPVEKEKWSIKKLFGVATPIINIIKGLQVFDTVSSFCLVVLLALIGFGEITKGGVSWPLYLLAGLFALLHLSEKGKNIDNKP